MDRDARKKQRGTETSKSHPVFECRATLEAPKRLKAAKTAVNLNDNKDAHNRNSKGANQYVTTLVVKLPGVPSPTFLMFFDPASVTVR